MGTNLRLAQAEVRTERRADGSIVLRSPEKLAPYARRVTEWLVQWSDKAPDRIFLAERKGEGWRKLSYREAYGAVPAGPPPSTTTSCSPMTGVRRCSSRMSIPMKIILHVLLLAFAQLAVAQTYPSKPIRMIVGYTAGGGADALARLVAGRMSESLGQQVFVENRPGAGATIAADAAARFPPDGYTLFFADTALLIAPNIYAKLGFDPVKSFAPVSGACTTPLVVVVNPSLKAQTITELIALLKADPGRHAYGSPGIGTVHHLAMEMFKRQAGVSMVHVPYKGASAIIPDLISGQIQIGIISAPPALAQAKAGRLRPLALTSPVKVAGADWPALADTLSGFDASPRLFILAPAGTPEAVIARLNSLLRAILSSKEVLEALAAQGASADWSTPQELGARIADEVRRWAQIAKDAGIKAE